MRKMKLGILLIFAVLALVSVASAALPASVNAKVTWFGPVSYFEVDVTSGGNLYLPNANDYLGWCADSQIIGVGPVPNTYTPYDTRVAIPAGIPVHAVNWNKVNYIINHKGGYSKAVIQQAIWYFDGGRTAWPQGGAYLESDVLALIADANLNGGAYVPSVPGVENYAVLLWNSRTLQPIVIEVPIPTIPSPEFPTLALPIAMLIGVVGAVQFIRVRKE